MAVPPDRTRYFVLPVDPTGILGSADSRAGTGTLSFYENRFAANARPKYTITLEGPANWHRGGGQPFVWDYFPPFGDRNYPIILLVIDRSVGMKLPRQLLQPRFLGPTEPFLLVHRPQGKALIPEPYARIVPRYLVGSPTFWSLEWPQTEITPDEVTENGWFAVVRPDETGVVIQDNRQRLRIELRAAIEEDTKAAAFWYEVRPWNFPDKNGLILRVVRTENVRLRAGGEYDIIKKSPDILLIDSVLPVEQFQRIPQQGAPLPRNIPPRVNSRALYKIPTARTAWIIFGVELVISAIPIAGQIYEAAQFLYAVGEGKTFWGEGVGEDELFMMAVGAVLSTADEMVGAMRAARLRPGPHDPFAIVRSDEAVALIRSRIDPVLAEAVVKLPTAERNRILELLVDYQHGRMAAEAVLQHLPESLSRTFLKLKSNLAAVRWLDPADVDDFFEAARNLEAAERLSLAREVFLSVDRASWYQVILQRAPEAAAEFDHIKLRRHLERVFNQEFQAFRIEDIRIEFFKKSRIGQTVFDYALSQSRGRVHEILRRELGEKYHELIKRFRKGPKAPLRITGSALDHFRQRAYVPGKVAQPRIIAHSDFVKENKWYGGYYESDHILEDRFNVLIAEGGRYDRTQMLSILVPRDRLVASQIPGYTGHNHRDKTELLRSLIPNGTEMEFTLQQIWDAHVYCYKQTSDNWGAIVEHLKEEFEELITNFSELHGQDFAKNFDFGTNQTSDSFTPQRRWPTPRPTLGRGAQ